MIPYHIRYIISYDITSYQIISYHIIILVSTGLGKPLKTFAQSVGSAGFGSHVFIHFVTDSKLNAKAGGLSLVLLKALSVGILLYVLELFAGGECKKGILFLQSS